jgi:hypothetical protein
LSLAEEYAPLLFNPDPSFLFNQLRKNMGASAFGMRFAQSNAVDVLVSTAEDCNVTEVNSS